MSSRPDGGEELGLRVKIKCDKFHCDSNWWIVGFPPSEQSRGWGFCDPWEYIQWTSPGWWQVPSPFTFKVRVLDPRRRLSRTKYQKSIKAKCWELGQQTWRERWPGGPAPNSVALRDVRSGANRLERAMGASGQWWPSTLGDTSSEPQQSYPRLRD